MSPFLAVGAIAALINTILEGIPLEQRRATALAIFWAWWPLGRVSIPEEQAKAIEEAMKKVTP